MASKPHLFSYFYHLVTHAPLYRMWQSILALVRRFRLIAFLFRLLGILIAILQTGALVLLTTVLLLILLPLLLFLGLGILLTALLDTRRADRFLRSEGLEKTTVYILFPSRTSSEFWKQNALDLSRRGAVLLISPRWIAPDGRGRRSFYCTVRKEAPNVYWIRKYYFFHLRRRLLSPERTVLIY